MLPPKGHVWVCGPEAFRFSVDGHAPCYYQRLCRCPWSGLPPVPHLDRAGEMVPPTHPCSSLCLWQAGELALRAGETAWSFNSYSSHEYGPCTLLASTVELALRGKRGRRTSPDPCLQPKAGELESPFTQAKWESRRTHQFNYHSGPDSGLEIGPPQYLLHLRTEAFEGAGSTDSKLQDLHDTGHQEDLKGVLVRT